jgi:hypothetical protein
MHRSPTFGDEDHEAVGERYEDERALRHAMTLRPNASAPSFIEQVLAAKRCWCPPVVPEDAAPREVLQASDESDVSQLERALMYVITIMRHCNEAATTASDPAVQRRRWYYVRTKQRGEKLALQSDYSQLAQKARRLVDELHVLTREAEGLGKRSRAECAETDASVERFLEVASQLSMRTGLGGPEMRTTSIQTSSDAGGQ